MRVYLLYTVLLVLLTVVSVHASTVQGFRSHNTLYKKHNTLFSFGRKTTPKPTTKSPTTTKKPTTKSPTTTKASTTTKAPTAPTSAPTSAPTAAPTTSGTKLLFGTYTTSDPFSSNIAKTLSIEAMTGRRSDIVHWYQSWGGGDWISKVQPQIINAVTSQGRIPLITWEPWAPGPVGQPTYQLQNVINGAFDSYIKSWATGLKAIGSVVYLRPMHEMNGNWYPWTVGNGNNGNTFTQAWIHMHNIFTQAGATNVRWVWCVNGDDVPFDNRLENYYPGQQYVDVLSLDGYNWGSTSPDNGGWRSFDQIVRSTYNRLVALGPQPIWVAETASDLNGGDKAQWVRDMFTTAATMPNLQAIVWFNEDKEHAWAITSPQSAVSGFKP